MTDGGRRAFRAGIATASGMPGLVMGASFLGFGSLVRGAGLDFWAGMASTLTAWALPGQVVMVELYGIGASFPAMVVAVFLTNARLLPMTVTLLPLLRHRSVPEWHLYGYAHLIALTSWAVGMVRVLDLAREHRMPYFLGLGVTLWAISLVGTAGGYALAGSVPPAVTLGLVFLNPLYFLLMMVSDFRSRARVLAIGLGGVLGAPLHLAAGEWGLLLTGLIAGSTAFAVHRVWMRRDA